MRGRCVDTSEDCCVEELMKMVPIFAGSSAHAALRLEI